jgi:hypothetical protein
MLHLQEVLNFQEAGVKAQSLLLELTNQLLHQEEK